ncbi:MAG TPA: hypothetical protein VEV43_13385 [Actinomycetota bacterium]|nr:hypothetical protein [Actinomycetota bacterium]
MTEAEQAAYNEFVLRLVRVCLDAQQRRNEEIRRSVDRIRELIEHAPFELAPRRRGLFR